MMRKTFIILLLAGVLASCSAMKKLVSPSTWLPQNSLKRIDLIAESDANSTSATRINIVFLRSEEAARNLPNSSREWFRNRSIYVGSLGNNAMILDLQLPPAASTNDVAMPEGARKAKTVVLFADYLDAGGQTPMQLGEYREVTVVLARDTIRLQESK